MPELAQITVKDCGIPAALRFTDKAYPRNPWFVKAWQGKIWVANGNAANTGPDQNSGSSMISYNPATGVSTIEYTNSDEQIFTFREINGELWAAGGDKDAGGSNQWLYKYASGSWSKTEVIPFAEHAYDLYSFGGYVYSGGGTTGAELARSGDSGATWTTYDGTSSRAYYFFEFNGDLYVSGNDGAFQYTAFPTFEAVCYPHKWTGSGFTKISDNLCPSGVTNKQGFVHRAETVNSKLVYILADNRNDHAKVPWGLFASNTTLTGFTQITLDTDEIAYDLKKYSSTVYVLTSKPDGSGGYTTRIRTTTDAATFPVLFEFTTTSFGLSFDILNGEYFIAQGYDITGATQSAETGRLYRVKLNTLSPLYVLPPNVWGRQSLVYSDNGVTIKEESGTSQMRLGAQTHVAQGWNVNDTVRLLKDANLSVARDEHYWDGTEYSAGVYTFSGYSHPSVYANQAAPIDWLFTADFFNSLYDSGGTPYSSGGQTAFANYAAAVVNNYKQIKAVEVWNEINGGTWTNGTFASDKPGYYKTLCQKVYNAVKAVRPEVTVIGGATVLIAAPFWQALKDNGALAYMDACSIHPYDAQSTWEARLAELRSIIGDKPLWVTEFGEANITPGWFCRAITILDSFDVHTAILYLLRSDGSFPGWGLYNSSGVPYSVREAARFMSSLIGTGNGRFRRVSLLDNGLHAYQRGDTWIVWGTGHPLTVKPGVIVRNASGEQVAVPATLGSDPIVLEGVRLNENVAISASPQITSFADDFGTANWAYYARAISGGALTTLSQVDNGYYYYKGLPGTYLRIESIAMHPESSYDAQARYTAPRTIGACTASFSFQVPDTNSNGIVATILKNGVSVWSQTVLPANGTVSSTASLSLNSGDTVDVRVNNNGSTSFDATSVTFSITQ